MNIIKKLFGKKEMPENPALEMYRVENRSLRAELEELKKVKIKLEILQAYIDDDDAVLELFDAIVKKDSVTTVYDDYMRAVYNGISSRQAQQNIMNAYGGGLGSLGQNSMLGLGSIYRAQQ